MAVRRMLVGSVMAGLCVNKRIQDPNSPILLSIAEILRIDRENSKSFGRSQNGGVPIGDPITRGMLNSNSNELMVDRLARPCRPLLNPLQRLLN